jgi:hypothetical protein
MAIDLFLLVAIAEIAGIFVGFGALIGVTRPEEISPFQVARLRALVTVGLTIIIASLIPVALDLYGVADHTLWLASSFFFYFLNLIVIIMAFRDPSNRELMKTETQRRPVTSILFWLVLEVPFHVLLILIMLGLFLALEPAFYTTALLIYLFQAAFALVQLVHSQDDPPSAEE